MGKPLAISLLVIWLFAIVLYFIIDPLFDAQIAETMTKYPKSPAGVSVGTLSPGHAIFYGVALSIVFAIHWWLSGLFGKPGASRKPIANTMLIVAGVATLLEIFEHGALDFYNYSLFCSSDEATTVILVDEVYPCDRSLTVRKAAQWAIFVFPILAIPVRILESRLGDNKA